MEKKLTFRPISTTVETIAPVEVAPTGSAAAVLFCALSKAVTDSLATEPALDMAVVAVVA